MSTEKMRKEFQAAYIEGLVARCGEGFRSTAEYSLEQMRPDGEYLNYPDFIAWWAWQASRAAIEVELPERRNVPDRDCWSRTNALGYNTANHECRTAIESLGLKVKPCS